MMDFMRDENRDIPLQTKRFHCFPASRLPDHHGWQHDRDSQPVDQVCPGKTMNIQVTDNLVSLRAQLVKENEQLAMATKGVKAAGRAVSSRTAAKRSLSSSTGEAPRSGGAYRPHQGS